MDPRQASSQKWTSFPEEFQQHIQEAFAELFENQLPASEIVSEGRIYPEEILLRLGYCPEGELTQRNFEASIDFSQPDDPEQVMATIHLVLDCLTQLFQEHFENPDKIQEYPRHWQPIRFRNHEIFIRFSTVNTSLEREADRWLGIDKEDSLVKEAQATGDAMDIQPREDDVDHVPEIFNHTPTNSVH